MFKNLTTRSFLKLVVLILLNDFVRVGLKLMRRVTTLYGGGNSFRVWVNLSRHLNIFVGFRCGE